MDSPQWIERDFPGGLDCKESSCNSGDPGSIPALERSPGGGNGNPFQDSCLENPKDREAWWTIVHGFTMSWTWLRDEHFHIFFPFIFISWRLITLQYSSGFCHTLTWINHGFTCVPHPIPPPASLPIPSLWVFPVHQPWALVSCIQPGLVICFTVDNIHVLMLFSQNTPPSPSPTESKSLFCTSVSLFLFCI